MALRRTVLLALLVVLAGCTGVTPSDSPDQRTTDATTPVDTVTTTETTEPHTGVGTSHASSHFVMRAHAGVENVTVTLAPDGDTSTAEIEPGPEHSFTRAIHDRGHDVRVVVERDGEVVFDQTVREYEYHEVTVQENETSVTQSVV